jgi:hypothetical protein
LASSTYSGRVPCCSLGEAKPGDVPITSTERSRAACEDVGEHSARSSVDNCYRDYAVNNAQQFMDLLKSADVPVAEPKG